MGGGAWSFLVGGVICLVNSVNERDLSLLTSYANLLTGEASAGRGVSALLCRAWILEEFVANFLEGLFVSSKWKFEAITGL